MQANRDIGRQEWPGIGHRVHHVRVRDRPLQRLGVRDRGEDQESLVLAVSERAHATFRSLSARIRSAAARAI
jgi:hypothetical protein